MVHDTDAAAMARRDALYERGYIMCHVCEGDGRGSGRHGECHICHGATWIGPDGGVCNPDHPGTLRAIRRDRDAEIIALYEAGEHSQRAIAEMFGLHLQRVGRIIREAGSRAIGEKPERN